MMGLTSVAVVVAMIAPTSPTDCHYGGNYFPELLRLPILWRPPNHYCLQDKTHRNELSNTTLDSRKLFFLLAAPTCSCWNCWNLSNRNWHRTGRLCCRRCHWRRRYWRSVDLLCQWLSAFASCSGRSCAGVFGQLESCPG